MLEDQNGESAEVSGAIISEETEGEDDQSNLINIRTKLVLDSPIQTPLKNAISRWCHYIFGELA